MAIRDKTIRMTGWAIGVLIGTLLQFGQAWAQADDLGSEGSRRASADAGVVMLMVDGSSSMAEAFGAELKVDAAKRELSRFVAAWPQDVPLGLLAFGHRRFLQPEGACRDYEVLVPARSGSGPAINAALARLEPMGRTPLTDAIRAAADALGSAERKASIVVFTDGVDTCDQDPCAAVRDIAARGVDFRAHVISLAVGPDAEDSLRCIAEESGGGFYPVSEAVELVEAFEDLSVVLNPDVRLVAVLGPGEAALERDLAWRIDQLLPDGTTRAVDTGGVMQPVLGPEPGLYRVTVRYGAATVETTVPLGSGTPRRIVLILNAGNIGVQIAPEITAVGPVRLTVTPEGQAAPLLEAEGEAGLFLLPAGTYTIEASRGIERATTTAVVEPAMIDQYRLAPGPDGWDLRFETRLSDQ